MNLSPSPAQLKAKVSVTTQDGYKPNEMNYNNLEAMNPSDCLSITHPRWVHRLMKGAESTHSLLDVLTQARVNNSGLRGKVDSK